MTMGADEDDAFFENRRKVMFVTNVLIDNDAYVDYMRSKGLGGVQVLDLLELFGNVFGPFDEADIKQTLGQLVHEGLLVSMGGGIVANPNPPISVDSEGIKIEIETIGYEEVDIEAD